MHTRECVCVTVCTYVCMCGGHDHEVSFDVVGDFELVAVELDSLQVYQEVLHVRAL